MKHLHRVTCAAGWTVAKACHAGDGSMFGDVRDVANKESNEDGSNVLM